MSARLFQIMLILVASLLLTSCMQQPGETPVTVVPTATTSEPTEEPTTIPTTAPTETPTTAPTEAPVIEPTEPAFTPDLWKPQGEHLSYKEYFSKDRYYGYTSVRSWVISRENTGYLFTLNTNGALTITSETLSGSYHVPNSAMTLANYGNPDFVGTDGRSAYFANDTQIVRIDLETGAATELLTAEKLQNVHMGCGTVLYYIRYEQGTPFICRLYAPEVREDILRILDTPYYHLSLLRTLSSHGQVKWTGINPLMMEQLKTELKNPNSPYQKDGNYDYSHLWLTDDLLTNPHYFHDLIWIFRNIQEDTGIHAEIQRTYDCFTGTYAEQTGVMDDCWVGTNLPHDHFGWETTKSELPSVVDSDWQRVSLEEPSQSLEALVYDRCYTDEAGYFLTDSGTIIKVPNDGGNAEILYTARYGRLMDVHFQKVNGFGADEYLCTIDGNRFVMIDPRNGQFRDVLKHDHFHDTMNWTDGRLYFSIVDGMFYQQYLFDPETAEFEETFFV